MYGEQKNKKVEERGMIGGKENKKRKGGQEEERRTKKKIGRGVHEEAGELGLEDNEGKKSKRFKKKIEWCKCSNWRKKHF